MSAALIDLVSVGAQDVYITGDPQVSFFRQNYKRHTNFSPLNPNVWIISGRLVRVTKLSIPIRSKGDLLSYVWIENANINLKNDNAASLFSSATAPTEFSLWMSVARKYVKWILSLLRVSIMFFTMNPRLKQRVPDNLI